MGIDIILIRFARYINIHCICFYCFCIVLCLCVENLKVIFAQCHDADGIESFAMLT